ncbi:MAG: hypothetical protein DU429_03845 [Candidatus Tokpelaia sp.]|nr:MAG: hypothetical protein DU430_06540 [Candidatus Tokpelaia sp.]KAA6206992.1 MAG: hypothetical protein DU429_03845 [Candidatus Tokpelaia sp.]
MKNYERKLNLARNGGGILFCGAGFSADCLSFSDGEVIGAGEQLLKLLNKALDEKGKHDNFKKLQNAAKCAKRNLGEAGLMQLLQQEYTIKNVTGDMADILQFPWAKIYTTNYDNALEQAMIRAGKKYKSLNNLDVTTDEEKSQKNGMPIIHLHGFIDKWDINNFAKSCILDADSYHETENLKECLDIFRRDLDKAEVIVFVGFNVEDFHLQKILRNVSGLREKIYFINKPTAEIDPDIRMTQEEFGIPLYIGREGFAKRIHDILQQDRPREPVLTCFKKYERPESSTGIAGTKDIENLLIYGEVNDALLARDIDVRGADYHVPLDLEGEIRAAFQGKVKIALLTGSICDGKTLLTKILMLNLSVNRPVFEFRKNYANIFDEIAKIYAVYPDPVLIIENCFSLHDEHLIAIARQAANSEGCLFLTARDISREARSGDIKQLEKLENFRHFVMPPLSEAGIIALAQLADQIAGWHDFHGTNLEERKRFIKEKCKASLPTFLMELLHSDYVRDIYKKEWNKIPFADKKEKQILVAILYISHLGGLADIGFLSQIFGTDVGGFVSKITKNYGDLRLFRVKSNGAFVETVLAIGARNILRELVRDEDIIDTIAFVAERMAEDNYISKEDYHISNFVRYSLISPLLGDKHVVTRFYDRISKPDTVRRYILFWVQWSIALRELGELEDAKDRLEQAYQKAKTQEKHSGQRFDYVQLDDVKAKLLIAEHKAQKQSSAKFLKDMHDAMQIIGNILQRNSVTQHPYDSLAQLIKLFELRKNDYSSYIMQSMGENLKKRVELGKKRLSFVTEGYPRNQAKRALESITGKFL